MVLQSSLGTRFLMLSPLIQDVHKGQYLLLGKVKVLRGKFPNSCLGMLLRLPKTGDYSFTGAYDGLSSQWVYDIGELSFKYRCEYEVKKGLTESFGNFEFRVVTLIQDGQLKYHSTLTKWRRLAWVWRLLRIRSEAFEKEVNGVLVYGRSFFLPWGSCLLTYSGVASLKKTESSILM